jgi:ribose transport system ATP-binding protein
MTDVNGSAGHVALRLVGISKRFGSMNALDAVNLEVAGGEVHGLLGENGSGKSTLVKILAGYHAPEPGGRAWAWEKPLALPIRHTDNRGIAIIHQDLGLVDSMTVVENIGISVGYDARPFGPCNWRRERATAKRLLAELGSELDPNMVTSLLTPARRTLVAIARARRQIEARGNNRLLFVLDEPTAALPHKEVAQVLELMRSLARAGDGVLFISHRLEEVLTVTDRVTVLRDGQVVATTLSNEADESELARLMLGRRIDSFYPTLQPSRDATIALSVEGISGGSVDHASFQVRSGEIVGFTGLTGQGYEELPGLVAGASVARRGVVQVGTGRPFRPTPRAALVAGIVLLPGDRGRYGLWSEAAAWENICLPALRRYKRASSVLRPSREIASSRILMDTFRVKPNDPRLVTSSFSGGNQQKIVLAKWLQLEPRVLLLDEPTKGVDVGARRDILQIICDAAANGAAVAIFSSDLEQLVNVCHRVLVFRNGKIAAEHVTDITEPLLAASCQIGPDATQSA